jgi:tetratricopeptide (TPR) repeat protein
MAPSAAMAGSVNASRTLNNSFFMGLSLCALCETRAEARNRFHRASYSSWRHLYTGAPMRTFVKPLVPFLLLAAAGTAFGAGSGSMPSMPRVESASPEDQARDAYNAGVHSVDKADELTADATRQTDARKQQKALDKAKSAYAGARKKFSRAVELNPRLPEAWNYLGYTSRKLGDYEAALSAYDHALALKPGFPEAIEYRGHAYLGLNRLNDAKQAYLALYGSNRKLAAQLLSGMQDWIGTHRGNPAGVDAASFEAFASWVSERSAIAAQTASLTREGASATW